MGLLIMAVVSFLGYKSSTWSQEGSFQSQLVTLSSQEKPVTIAVATDLHYLSSSLTDGGTFFTDLVKNADGKTCSILRKSQNPLWPP